jgi:hypothetical protein
LRCSRNLPAVGSTSRGDPLVGLTSPTERHPKRSPLPDVPPQFPAVSGEPPFAARGDSPGQAPVRLGQCRRGSLSATGNKAVARQYPSHGIWSPTAHEESEVHSTRVCLARYVPLPGFPTLLGVFSSRNRPVLFHTGNALGVSPPGLCPPHGDGALSSLVAFLALPGGFPKEENPVGNCPGSAPRQPSPGPLQSSVPPAAFKALLSVRVRVARG